MTEYHWWCRLPILIEQADHDAIGGQTLDHFDRIKSLQFTRTFLGRFEKSYSKAYTRSGRPLIGPWS